MIKTIFGNYEFQKQDFAKIYAEYLIEELDGLCKHEIAVLESTGHGFLTTAKKISLVSGIYFIYKDNNLVYVGQTGHCIRQRIGRFLAGIRGTEHEDEQHPAAYKYIEYFGRDISGLSFKHIRIDLMSLEHDVSLEDIETHIIQQISPMFNSKIYKKYRYQKMLKITDILGNNNERIVTL